MYRVLDGNGVSLMTSLDSLTDPFVVVTAEALYGDCNSTANFLRTEIDKAAGQQLGKERAAVWKPELKEVCKMFKVLVGSFEVINVMPGTSWRKANVPPGALAARAFILSGEKAYSVDDPDFIAVGGMRILIVHGMIYTRTLAYVAGAEEMSEYLVIDMATNKIVAQKGLGLTFAAEAPPTPAAATVLGKLVEGKLRHDCVPPVALVALAEAMQNGADKYGKFNWRGTGVSRADYYAAMMRHLLAWAGGEEVAPDSGVSHLGHIMANCAILLDGPQVE